MSALGKEFPQKEELAIVRENHAAVIRELQRMQDDANYVSTWQPKTLELVAPLPSQSAPSLSEPQTLIYGNEKGQTEYTASHHFIRYERNGFVQGFQ